MRKKKTVYDQGQQYTQALNILCEHACCASNIFHVCLHSTLIYIMLHCNLLYTPCIALPSTTQECVKTVNQIDY